MKKRKLSVRPVNGNDALTDNDSFTKTDSARTGTATSKQITTGTSSKQQQQQQQRQQQGRQEQQEQEQWQQEQKQSSVTSGITSEITSVTPRRTSAAAANHTKRGMRSKNGGSAAASVKQKRAKGGKPTCCCSRVVRSESESTVANVLTPDRAIRIARAIYPGVNCGHKDCIKYPVVTPKHMGWLWTLEQTGGVKVRRRYIDGFSRRFLRRTGT